ncbi:ATP-binding protein [Vibrio sp. 10N]|uniref:ATP-binding protein n=1 Tax=Vibrio sp. 10N TaxID=3058938 RepID=UPI002812CCF3|nr:ATP-binding protein [Vibrio sp. 10N]
MASYQMRFNSSIDTSREIAAALLAFWQREGIQAPLVHDLELCVVELANNIYEHGYQEQNGKVIDVSCTVLAQKIEITMSHAGLSLKPDRMDEMLSTPLQELDPTDPLSWATSGRGFFILNTLMDEVSVHENKGLTSFTLIKLRP